MGLISNYNARTLTQLASQLSLQGELQKKERTATVVDINFALVDRPAIGGLQLHNHMHARCAAVLSKN